MVRRKAVWGSGAQLIAALLAASAVASCGDAVRQGTGSSYLIVRSFEAASGATPDEFGGSLASDVLTVVEEIPTIFNDVGRVTFQLAMKDAGIPGAPNEPTTNNFITLNRYRVRYIRSDGRNTPGVDVPYGFDGGLTLTVASGDAAVAFTLVRNIAKMEAPLAALVRNGIIITTIAEVTFYGSDQTGHEVSATAQILIDFGNFGDPS